MTKKMLVKWLEEQRAKALEDVAEQKNKALEQARAVLYRETGLDELAKQVQSRFEEIEDLVSAWREKFSDKISPQNAWYGSIHNTVYPYINDAGATRKKLIEYEFQDSAKTLKLIIDRFKVIALEVEKNYKNVLANVKRLDSAKLGMEYLESLGFDLKELLAQDTAPVETALSVPVDTRYLFMGGAKQ